MDHNTIITEELKLHIIDSFPILKSKKKLLPSVISWVYILSIITHNFLTAYADYKTVPPRD